jgi:hypothetical protein
VEKILSFGVYPEVGLKLARERRADAPRLVAAKTDPGAKRQKEKASRENAFPDRSRSAALLCKEVGSDMGG